MKFERCISMGAVIAILFVFLVATVHGNSNDTVNYSDVYKNRFCRLTNCPDNMLPHIGCNSTQQSSCGADLKLYPMSNKWRMYIVNQHNIFRNLIASGMVNRLPGSGAMLKLQWDSSLEEVASFLVKRCSLHTPKECISTSRYEDPSFQSVYNKFKKNQNAFLVLKSQMHAWFDQYKHATVLNVVDGSAENNGEVSHFRRMMVGASNHMGCAIAMSKKDGLKHQWMICLYSCTPKANEPLYSFNAVPGEHCSTGVDHEYPNLCNESEHVEDCRLDTHHE
ncbi:uncharacterized protein Dana_GF25115 [Drosophila ananassae]|uniref:SCP domain-containing protein n=1 Tax=Drosophila ananassae TaxID=7217 RepID=B3M9P8_DROAN|nr:antigen 5 like allergen Cul n 1 [Drosophila ananassae]EDV39054.2 uncharacterized protein Dana_GF25115 [Drosophila ananassae]